MFSIYHSDDEPNCIYNSIRPLYITSRLFGFFPFSVKIDPNGKKRICFTFIDFIIFVIQILIYLSLVYINVFYDLMQTDEVSPLLLTGMKVGLIFGLTNSIAFLLADLYNKRLIFEIFNFFQNFDLELQLLGKSLNNKLIKTYTYSYFGVFASASCLFTFISFWTFTNIYSTKAFLGIYVANYLSTSVIAVVLSIYSFFLLSVRTRYSLLNDSLRKLSIKTGGASDATDTTVVKSSTKYLTKKVMQLADLHDMLNNTVDKVNRCYSIQAMLAFAVCFTFVVFGLFSVYRGWLMSTVSKIQLQMSMCISMWATFHMFFVFTVLWAGHSARHEGKFTGVLLHRKINKCFNIEVVERLMAFSHQVNNRSSDATCNLFSFDWTLLYSIIAATTTYLIILIQFDASGYEPSVHGLKNSTSSN